MKRIWVLSIVLLAVAAVEFGALGAASAGASFMPGWLTASKDSQAKAAPTPGSPPSCQPDRQHGGQPACNGEPASIQLTPDPLVIQCDGLDHSTLTVRITDANGHPVADGTYVSFWAYNGNTTPSSAQTNRGVVSTSVSFYGDIFAPGPNVNVDVGPLEAGIRIRCFPESNRPPSPPPCSPSPPSVSPPCPTPTPFPSFPTPTTCPTTSPSSGPVCGDSDIGSATIAVNPPSGQQVIGAPFQAPIDLISFAPGTSTTWAGYQLELAYDGTLLQANSSARGLCSAEWWANPQLAPYVVSGCIAQSSTSTGTLETITFTCLRTGSSSLHLILPGESDPVGTQLFDDNASPFATTLVDGSVACAGAGLTPTPSPAPTPAIGLFPFEICVALPGSPCPTPTASAIHVG
jgi:hypothetical protein